MTGGTTTDTEMRLGTVNGGTATATSTRPHRHQHRETIVTAKTVAHGLLETHGMQGTVGTEAGIGIRVRGRSLLKSTDVLEV